ncbi:glycosyltransferase family 2 protein [Geobacter sp.]|uniref:glycosyltransferase family 2 protein n=1 Tax=Geobacter sp. TaxID=46610 RepID=UPI0027B9D4A2|nr:glycosyltransferase family 2 protein [Geobacter sp.]
MKSNDILFSIIIPAYNYGHMLARAVESALSQEGDDYEVIVIDDGSTDDTPAVVEMLVERFPQRLRTIRQQNQGPAAVRNRGVAESLGEYLIFLDADDRLLPDALTKFRNFLVNSGQFGMVFAGHRSIHPDGRIKVHRAKSIGNDRMKNFLGYIRKDFGISNGATIMAREVLSKIRYPEHLRNSEDIPVFAQVLACCNCTSFPDPVVDIFKHDDSLRNNISLIMKTGAQVVDCLFDPKVLPTNFMKFRDEMYARQCLSLFRSLYLVGQYATARSHFHQAARVSPGVIWQWSFVSKYLRSYFRG